MLATLFYDDVEADAILRIPGSIEKRKNEETDGVPSLCRIRTEAHEKGHRDMCVLGDPRGFSLPFSSSCVLHGSFDFPELEACLHWWADPHQWSRLYLLAVNNCKAVGTGYRSDCCLLPIELPLAPHQSLLTCGITRQRFGRNCVSVIWVTRTLEVGMIGLVVQREQGGGTGGGSGSGSGGHPFSTSILSPTSLSSPPFPMKSTGMGSGEHTGGEVGGSGLRGPVETTHTAAALSSTVGSVGVLASSWRSASGAVGAGGWYGKLCLQVDQNRCLSGVLMREIRDIFACEAAQQPLEKNARSTATRRAEIQEAQVLSGCILSEVPPGTFQDGGWKTEEKEISTVMLFTNGRSVWRVFLHPDGSISHHAFVDNKRVTTNGRGEDRNGSPPGPEREGLFHFLDDRDLAPLPNLQHWNTLQALARAKHPELSGSWTSLFPEGNPSSQADGQPGRGRGSLVSRTALTSSSRWWSGFFTGKSRCHVQGTTPLASTRRYLCLSAVQQSPGWFALLRWDGLLEFYDGVSEEMTPLWSYFPTCHVPYVKDAASMGTAGSFDTTSTSSSPPPPPSSSSRPFVSFLQWAKFSSCTQRIDVVTVTTTTSIRMGSSSTLGFGKEVEEGAGPSFNGRKARNDIQERCGGSSSYASSGTHRVVYFEEAPASDREDAEVVVTSQQLLWTSAPTNLPFSSEERIALRNSVVLPSPFPGGLFGGCGCLSQSAHRGGDSAPVEASQSPAATTPGPPTTCGNASPTTGNARLLVLWKEPPFAVSHFSTEDVEEEAAAGGGARVGGLASDASHRFRRVGRSDNTRRSIASMLQDDPSPCPVSAGDPRMESGGGGELGTCLLQTVDTVELWVDGGDDEAPGPSSETERAEEGSDHGAAPAVEEMTSARASLVSSQTCHERRRRRRDGERQVQRDRMYRVDGGIVSALLTQEEGTTVAVESYFHTHRLHVVEDRCWDAREEAGRTFPHYRSWMEEVLERVTLPAPLHSQWHPPSRSTRGWNEAEGYRREEKPEEEEEVENRWFDDPHRAAGNRSPSPCFPSKGFRSLHLTPWDPIEEDMGWWEEAKRWLQEEGNEEDSAEGGEPRPTGAPPGSFLPKDKGENNAWAVFAGIIDALERHPEGSRVLLAMLRTVLDQKPGVSSPDGAGSHPLEWFLPGMTLPLDPCAVQYGLTASRVLGALHYALTYDLRHADVSTPLPSCFSLSRYYIASSISRQLLHRLVFVVCLLLGWSSRCKAQVSEGEGGSKDASLSASTAIDAVFLQLRLSIDYLSAAFFAAQAAGADLVTFGAQMVPRLWNAITTTSTTTAAADGDEPPVRKPPLPLFPLSHIGGGGFPGRLAGVGVGYLCRDAALFTFLSPDILEETSRSLIERCVSIGCGFYNGVSTFRASGTYRSGGGVQAAQVWVMHMVDRVPLLQHFLLLQDVQVGRTRQTTERLVPRCWEVMSGLSALSSLPRPTTTSSMVHPFSSSCGAWRCTVGSVLLEMGLLMTDAAAATYFSGMRLEVLRFLLDRYPAHGGSWYAVGVLRRLVYPKGGAVLLVSASSVRTFFLEELRKLRQVVELEIHVWETTRTTSSRSSSTNSGGWVSDRSMSAASTFAPGASGEGISSSMWDSVRVGLLELHLDTLLGLACSAYEEGEVVQAFHYLEEAYQMLSTPPPLKSSVTWGRGEVEDSKQLGSVEATRVTMTDYNSKNLSFFQQYLSYVKGVVKALTHRVCGAAAHVRLLVEMSFLSPRLEEWIIHEWANTIGKIGEPESSRRSLQELSAYTLHHFLIQRHAYGVCGRVLSDLVTELRCKEWDTPHALRMDLIARLTALALNAVESINSERVSPEAMRFASSTNTREEAAIPRVGPGAVPEGERENEVVEYRARTGEREACSVGFPMVSAFSSLSARALTRHDLPWLRLRVHVAYCESILYSVLPCERAETIEKKKKKEHHEEEEGGVRRNRQECAAPLSSLSKARPMGKRRDGGDGMGMGGCSPSLAAVPSGVPAGSMDRKWMDLWVEAGSSSAALLYKAASQLMYALGMQQHWPEAFRLAVLLKEAMRCPRYGCDRSKEREPTSTSAASSLAALAESVDPWKVLECWAANLVSRPHQDRPPPPSPQKCFSSGMEKKQPGTCEGGFVEEREVEPEERDEEEEEEWDKLLFGCAECSSLSNQYRGFSVALIAALTTNYDRTPRRLLKAYHLVDPYGTLKSLLIVQQAFQHEADSFCHTNPTKSAEWKQLACVACVDAACIANCVLEEASKTSLSYSSLAFTAGLFDTLGRIVKHLESTCPEVLRDTDQKNRTTQFVDHFMEVLSSHALP